MTGNSEQHHTVRHNQQIHNCGNVNRDADTATYTLPEPLVSEPNALEVEKLTRYNSPNSSRTD